jgi:hypothetical protein
MIMHKPGIKGWVIVMGHAFVGWAFCAAIMGVGLAITSVQTTLIAHAIGGPLGFAVISLFYFKKYNYTTPIRTALIFVGFVVFMDVFLVALVIEKSFQMFASILGTWIPFALTFVATYLSGVYTRKRSSESQTQGEEDNPG